MKMRIWLALFAAMTPGSNLSVAHADGRPLPVSAFLCDTAAHAIQFADLRAKGEGEEIARDRVGRAAKADVCGRYAGRATIESETVSLSGGVAFRVTAFRFEEDHRLAWLAETSFAPGNASWSL